MVLVPLVMSLFPLKGVKCTNTTQIEKNLSADAQKIGI